MLRCFNIKTGFTLIEVIVAVAIFSAIVSAASGVFVSAVRTQRRALAAGVLIDETFYAVEYMGRAIRMARKELSTPACLSKNGLNYEITRGGKGLKFINSQGTCQEFFWDTNEKKLKEAKGAAHPVSITSGNTQLADSAGFAINLVGADQINPDGSVDNDQPRVTFFINIKGLRPNLDPQPEIKIQTTLSQRNLDIYQ